jgi:hypothetical protein
VVPFWDSCFFAYSLKISASGALGDIPRISAWWIGEGRCHPNMNQMMNQMNLISNSKLATRL